MRTGGSQKCHRTQAPEVRHIQCREINGELKWFSDLIIAPNLISSEFNFAKLLIITKCIFAVLLEATLEVSKERRSGEWFSSISVL